MPPLDAPALVVSIRIAAGGQGGQCIRPIGDHSVSRNMTTRMCLFGEAVEGYQAAVLRLREWEGKTQTSSGRKRSPIKATPPSPILPGGVALDSGKSNTPVSICRVVEQSLQW